jgi:hypothetical protein
VGSSGKNLKGHGQGTRAASPGAQAKDGYGQPPHPLVVRTGQLYWPRHARTGRRQFQVTRALPDGTVHGKRTDHARDPVTVTAARLLAVRADGYGEHYSFIGWSTRTYVTWACLVAANDDEVTLVLPEWHPSRTVRAPARALPSSVCMPGDWARATADLSAARPAHLRLTLSGACADPGRGACPAPALTPTPH